MSYVIAESVLHPVCRDERPLVHRLRGDRLTDLEPDPGRLHALRDPSLLADESHRMAAWIDSLG